MTGMAGYDISIWVDCSEEEAGELLDEMCLLACGGTGEGKKHVCKRGMVGSLKPSTDNDEG